MGRWIWIGAGALFMVFLADTLASAIVINRIAGQNAELVRDADGATETFPVSTQALLTEGQPPRTARALGGRGVLFGTQMTYAVPTGALITCRITLLAANCDGGWRIEFGMP
ncbi:MAG: hypothetical protein AAFR35_13795 [Pseudomonadota bacterium]